MDSKPQKYKHRDSPGMSMNLAITCKHNSPREEQIKRALTQLVTQYSLERVMYNNHVTIDETAEPTSSPLTLNTRHLNNPAQLLAEFIHHQIACFLAWRKNNLDGAIEDLRVAFPKLCDSKN